MFLRYCFYLVDTLGILLPENLIGDASGQHVAGVCQLGQRLVSSLVQTDPLAKLLIEKGLITREEFIDKLSPPSLPELTLRDPRPLVGRMRHMPKYRQE
jgi:hypothetical protein